jgi:hypothetical protein
MLDPELRVSLIPFYVNSSVLVYTHVSVGVFTRTPFFLSRLVDSTFQRMDEALLDGCLAVFLRLKGRKNVSLFFIFDYLGALIVNRYIVGNTIISELGG